MLGTAVRTTSCNAVKQTEKSFFCRFVRVDLIITISKTTVKDIPGRSKPITATTTSILRMVRRADKLQA